MDTAQLRQLTSTAAARYPKSKLWPNGLGFDAGRWEYCYSEAYASWQALYRPRGYGLGAPSKVGRGPTPEAAKAAATRYTDD